MKIKFLVLFFAGLLALSGNALICPPDFNDTGTHCLKPPSYGRGLGHRTMARCELEHGAGNCEKCLSLYFHKCNTSYENQGCNVCAPICPPNTTDVGLMCQK